ncbi:class I SAM-dependent methyltransferase [Echinicola rosea]|uniref:Ubiquinone/menaquinone biosynthesis C-methyltransferase UbiE n=1 Tax=Echinicola rosea TaxID=1807691 RepID=A0ABQ1UQP4_9BACT|nr:class I SAM-dependent methyltransferase [Echinicola rosea]GGF22539.1 ubiquinone/menaquinone biosynthesis C-methyltransferase UbiE [Echinicola rosea]
MATTSGDLYDPTFVKGMFDRMSNTYGLANLVTSFGFTAVWRYQCIAALPVSEARTAGYDLMSGMGESWPAIQRRFGKDVRIMAVDISDEMNHKARRNIQRHGYQKIKLRQLNILDHDLPEESAEFIVSTFGLKTFSLVQQEALAKEMARLLKPGGAFSLIEISEPRPRILKWLYMFYLKVVIPWIGKVFLGNKEDYRMLGKYCEHFKNSRDFYRYLKAYGMEVSYKSYFFGCATGVYGIKR